MWRNLIQMSTYGISNVLNSRLRQMPRELRQLKASYVRGCSTTSNPINVEKPKKEYILIYKIDEIKFLAAVSKIKGPLGTMTLSLIPFVSAFEYSNIISTYGTIVFAFIGFSLTGMLTIFSIIFDNTIGIIKCNEKQDELMISYVNFWGKRVDEIVPLDNIIPLCDLPQTITNKFYITVRRTESNVTRKLFLGKNYIKDKEKFDVLLGNY